MASNSSHFDNNDRPTLTAVSSADLITPVTLVADPTTHALLVNNGGAGGIISINGDTTSAQIIAAGTGISVTDNGTGTHTITATGAGTGTVTSVSVVSANGFAGSVATPTVTPAITLTTSVNAPALAGNGTAISAATTTGSGSTVVLGTGPSISGATITTSSVNGVTLTTGGGTTTFLNANGAYSTPAGGGLTVGSSTITGGTTTKVLFDNAGFLGEYTISGSGNVAMTTSPVFTTPTLGAATATTINGNTFTTGTYTLTGTAAKTLNFTNTLTLSGTDSTTMTFPTTSATIARTDAGQTFTGVQVFTSPTLGTPTINGTPTGTGVSSTPTASIIPLWDASKNLSANNLIEGFTTTATAAGTTTLTITNTYTQVFTGTTTQTVLLPTTSVAAGGQYAIINLSTGAVTVQSSGANTITILAAGTSALFTALVATPTTAANWNSQYLGSSIASGKLLTVSNTLTLAGTDATIMTFPSTSQTIAGLTATQTLTNKRVTRRLVATTQSVTPTINTDNTDVANITGLAQAITSMTTNLSGTPVDGDFLEIRITDNGTARAITWGASFEATTVALPTTTVISTMLRVGFEWNATASKWDCIAVA